MPVVCRRRMPGVDLATAHCDPDVCVEAIALVVMPLGLFDDHITRENVTRKTFKMPGVVENVRPQGL